MTSTFKLTKAEFKKIFKRPSVFIMAVLLVLVILISAFIFNPIKIPEKTIYYDNVSTSREYYDNFFDDTIINSKQTFDNGFNQTNRIIYYYKSLNSNTTLLSTYYTEIIDTIELMNSENNTSTLDGLRIELKHKIETFIEAYKNLDSLNEFSDITIFTKTDISYKGAYNGNYYKIDACKYLNQFYEYSSNSAYTSKEVVNFYNTNNLKNELKIILEHGINFICTTINGFVYDFNTFFNNYNNVVNNANKRYEMQNLRDNIELLLKNFSQYLTLLVDYDFPIVIIDKDIYLAVKQKIDDAIVNIAVNQQNNSNLDTHKNIKYYLDSCKILKTFDDLKINIQQVKLPINIVNKLEEIQNNVELNKEIILNNIDSLSSDESTTNISKEITNYSLLQSSYDSLINNKVKITITNQYDTSIYTNFYGHDFDVFNKYQARENVTINSYSITNNIYSNSYISNFSYSQNSDSDTSVYDFMYFTLELCTIIIIVFSMMLICNLITSETESGTIKLLLVRPFKRSKILTAKLIATLFFVLTFMLFSGILSFIGGYFIYGNVTTPILAVFNSATAFEISPFAMMLLNILFLSIDVIFFVLIALMISIICKNYAGAISCSLVILIVNYALNILFGGSFWYSLLPGMNLHWFKYFGNAFGSIIGGTSTLAGTIQSLLITGIQSSMTFWFSVFIIIVYSLTSLAISYSIFQKRDF